MREDLIESLSANSHYVQAGDLLLAEASKDDQETMARAFDCYVRANAFQKAIKVAQMSGQ